ncbi:DMT family transporter [Zhongshania arctica]|uniref:DMT family transporter n=1 Tax=Zhongshania arctica TaxID=3238302 RepID=A0ABV3TSQ9_9GAMM
MNSSYFYSSIMLVAGFGIPVMAALNGGLGAKLGNPALASTLLLLVGLLLSVIYLLVTEGVPTRFYDTSIPWYFYTGGVVVTFYNLAITWIAPRFGISNTVSFVLLGQLLAMTLIDHYGLIGAPQYPISLRRLAGLVLMVAGVFLVLGRSTK